MHKEPLRWMIIVRWLTFYFRAFISMREIPLLLSKKKAKSSCTIPK